MWKSYFGDTATIIGVDIDPACTSLEKDGFKVYIGDQADRSFWANFKLQHEYVDIVIDDGGHSMNQQIITFQELFPILSDGGMYICEDTHSSYFPAHGGGKGRPGTFHELVKSLMDEMHAWYYEPLDDIAQNYYANHLYSISVYDSIIVFEKRKRDSPVVVSKGSEGHVDLPTTMTYVEMRRAFGVPDRKPFL